MSPHFFFTLVAIGGIFLVLTFVAVVWAFAYTKVGPNRVLIVSGRKHRIVAPDGTVQLRGYRAVKGGGTFVMPVFEKVEVLSLEPLTIEFQTSDVFTSKGATMDVNGIAQVQIKSDDISITRAAERMLSKGPADIKILSAQIIESRLRATLGMQKPEEIYENRNAFAAKVQESASAELAELGLGLISFTIRDIRDKQKVLSSS
jgi:flotillin